MRISFFFPRSRKYSHIIFWDAAEDEEETGKDTGISRHRHVNCGSDLARRKEPICNILMLGKFVNVCTSECSISRVKIRGQSGTYLMKSVLAWTDMPSWSNTFIKWGIKSRNDIAKLFLGATNSFGSNREGSGLLVQC